MDGDPASSDAGDWKRQGEAAGQSPPAPPPDEGPGEGTTPELTLDGFSGPLEQLLLLARAHRIDWPTVSLAALVDQLSDALQAAPARIPLGQKGDWVVMVAWLLQLRSLLLLPADAPEQQAATEQAAQLRGQLTALAQAQVLAGWLNARPQLGQDVFARGQPEVFGIAADAGPAIDVIEFLWASMALFDDAFRPAAAEDTYRPPHFDLYTVADARERILQLLTGAPDGLPLCRLLPEPEAASEGTPKSALRRRSGWSSTFVASLELARQGEVGLEQAATFQSILVTPPQPDTLPDD